MAIILCGVPIILEAVIGLVTEFDVTADVLVSLALIASVFIGEDFAAGEVAFIMQLGGLLEELTVARARAGIERIVHLTPRTARRIARASAEGAEPRPVAEETIAAEAVQVGDILRVLPGEAVPVDGVIVSGQTSVNQAVMTGESLPVDKGPGDEVSSGTVNQFGSFDMAATRVGEDSSIRRMIRLVQSADAGKAKIVNLADRWAVWIVVIALVAAVLTYLVTGEIIRSVTILVVFCPCALVLATPTAIMAAIGNATRHGFLVREGDALERLAQVRRVCFDKTGTLTTGEPQVVSVCAGEKDVSEDALLAVAGAAEKRSEHPLGRAIVAAATEHAGAAPKDPTSFAMVPGRGVVAEVGGRTVYAGSGALLAEHGLAIPDALGRRVDAARAGGQRLPISAGATRQRGSLRSPTACARTPPLRFRQCGRRAWSRCSSRGTTRRLPPTWLPNSASPPTRPPACPRTSSPSSMTRSARAREFVWSATASTTRLRSSARSWASPWAASAAISPSTRRTSHS